MRRLPVDYEKFKRFFMTKWLETRPGEQAIVEQAIAKLEDNVGILIIAQIAFEAGRECESLNSGADHYR